MNYYDPNLIRVTSEVLTDETDLIFEIKSAHAWLLICSLQMTMRHPDLSDYVVSMLVTIAKQFEEAITDLHPEAQRLIEMGWDSTFDVPRGRNDER